MPNNQAAGLTRTIELANINNSGILEASVQCLEELLLKDDMKDREVAVISIAGAYRGGKSFMLNFFLRYLYSRYRQQKFDSEWLGKKDDQLVGFTWRYGSDRVTTGIHIWQDIFLHDYSDGRKIAIILMDTEGLFDSDSRMDKCTRIFALSTLLSSVQIFNVSQNIKESDLQNLQLFSEYGRLAVNKGTRPFQKLVFLVRDWMSPFEHEYGQYGGEAFMQKRLATPENQHTELRSTRYHIKNCFSKISCFLMPFPGMEVIRNTNFNGKLSDIEDDFKNNLMELVPLILDPENLVSKKLYGRTMNAVEFLESCKNYIEIFQNDELPEAMNIFEASSKFHNTNVVKDQRTFYKQRMNNVCGGDKPYIEPEKLKAEHLQTKIQAEQNFMSHKILGGDEFLNSYKKNLLDLLEEEYQEYQKINNAKINAVAQLLYLACFLINMFKPNLPAYAVLNVVTLLLKLYRTKFGKQINQ